MGYLFHSMSSTLIVVNCSSQIVLPAVTRHANTYMISLTQSLISIFVSSKGAIDQVPLNCLGPWHQLHWDGHEKLGYQALNMGGVSLPLYGGKDQYSSFLLVMKVIPNVCQHQLEYL